MGRKVAAQVIRVERLRDDDRQIFQGKTDVSVIDRTAGKLGAVTSGADDGGPDGVASQNIFPLAQSALADGLSQSGSHVSKSGGGVIGFDAVRHTAGKGNDGIRWG